jgi:hypothetical protein
MGADEISNSANSLSDEAFKQVTDVYLPPILEKVRRRAVDLAASANEPPSQVHVFRACDETFEGRATAHLLTRKRFWPWLEANFTGFMIITAILAIVFGYLGATNSANKEFLEIAKIFAGALVGAAAGAAVTAAKR